MKKLISWSFLILFFCIGCVAQKQNEFNFSDPTSAVAMARYYVDKGYAREEGIFTQNELRLSAVEYSNESTLVEVFFCVISSFKKDSSGHWSFKSLDIEMDQNGKFVSASSGDVGNGWSKPIF